ncbi:MAG: amidohydrolase family protein [Verrucomicrobiota bacterium]
MSRRAFLTTSTGATVPLSRLGAEEKTNWIDSHVHVWNTDRQTYPISKNSADHKPEPDSFMPAELFALQNGSGVQRTVLVQMSFYEFDNQLMLDVMNEYPGRFGGIGIVNHEEENVGEVMAGLGKQGVRGFRLYAFEDRVKNWETHLGMKTMWKTGGENGWAMCCLSNPGALPAIRKMCETYPDTPVVIDHFSRIGMTGEIDRDQLDRLCRLAELPRVHLKTSAYYALGKKTPPYSDLLPMFRQVRNAFGAERLLWGSDCPYQVQGEHTYEASLKLVTGYADFLSEEEREHILRGTAEKLFFS